MKKRLFSMALALVMALSLLPAAGMTASAVGDAPTALFVNGVDMIANPGNADTDTGQIINSGTIKITGKKEIFLAVFAGRIGGTGTIEAVAEPYAITVNEGTASLAEAAEGETVLLTANPAPTGQRFREWTVSPAVTFTDGTSKTDATAKFTMPGQPVTATANYGNISAGHTHEWDSAWTTDPAHHWHVCADETATSLTVTATAKGESTKKATATVTVKDTPVTKYLVTVNGGTGGGGGGTTTKPPTVTTDPTKPGTATDAKTDVKASVDGSGKAAATVPEKSVTDSIKAAQEAVKKNGTEENGISVTINLQTDKLASSIAATPPSASIDALVKAGVTELCLESSAGTVTLDLDALKAIQAAAGKVTVSLTRIDAGTLSDAAQDAIGSRPVFELSITVGGKATYLTGSSYDAGTKALRFDTNGASLFGIGYKQDAPSFTDTVGHWVEADIQLVVARGLLLGTSSTTFTPDSSMTRGMFMTALGRLAGIDAAHYTSTRFSDVPATAYYVPYVAWAAEQDITSGTTATTFAPDRAITRQEMAVLMHNYAKAMGCTIPKNRETAPFADSATIGAWATDLVNAMQTAGILNGKDGNRFDPCCTATRAEVAAVLRRFVTLVVDV